MWSDRRICDLFGIEHPIVLAPMAGPSTPELAIAVAEGGGLGSLASAMSTADEVRRDMAVIRQRTARPINLNFFAHVSPHPDPAREAAWVAMLRPYRIELGLDPDAPAPRSARTPFDAAMCAVVEEVRPEVVSFHFGLPEAPLLERVRATGAKIMASATTVREAEWLEAHGCDAIIAQGSEAGGHRGMFLSADIATQVGTMALVPQVVDAVTVPVIAAGGIADARGIAAAFALGAAAVQIGTAYLFCPEAKVQPLHRAALRAAREDESALTNIFTGRPARGILNRVMRDLGPMSDKAPAFPLAGGALAPLKAAAEAKGSSDFTSLWTGQAARLAREMPARDLTETLAREAAARMGGRHDRS